MNSQTENTNNNSRHRRSFFGPILLITIGLVFLGKNLGLIPAEGWSTVWRLWPLLLIIGGLDDLIRREGVAWPILMMGAGGVLLYNYFGPATWISWTQVLQLWPILLIAVGIDVIFRGQTGWRHALGILLSVVLIGGAAVLAFQGFEIQTEYAEIDQGYSLSETEAELDLSLSVGQLLLDSESQSGRLISGNITPGAALDDYEDSEGNLSYSLQSTKPTFFPYTARWELGLTPELLLDLDVNNSVGEMLLELADLELTSLLVNQGVGRMVVELPDIVSDEILIKQGVGVIDVEIPQDATVAVDAQNGLTRVKFPDGFELDDGYFMSSSTTKGSADLLIVVEQGIGLVRFQYKK